MLHMCCRGHPKKNLELPISQLLPDVVCVVGIMPSRVARDSSPPLEKIEIEVSQMEFPAF